VDDYGDVYGEEERQSMGRASLTSSFYFVYLDVFLVSEYSQSSSVLVARYRPPADENGRRERPTREEPHVQHLEKSEHRSEARLKPET
jgi:hypothetical protein